MPEGPSIVLLKEQVQEFKGHVIKSVSGNSKIGIERLCLKQVTDFKSWGKHFLICFEDFTVKIHFLLFGSYRINERKDSTPRLSLEFDKGEINLYSCSVKFLEGDLNSHYDWSADVMNPDWDPAAAKVKLDNLGSKMVCDVLLEQDIFSGVGNIIKNEILYLSQVHPESLVGKIPEEKISLLVTEASQYSFRFLEWKREYLLRAHWLAHKKKICARCNGPISLKPTGTKKRRSFFCANCQVLYQ